MTDEVLIKAIEMSFSDWKKMKQTQNEEHPVPKSNDLKESTYGEKNGVNNKNSNLVYVNTNQNKPRASASSSSTDVSPHMYFPNVQTHENYFLNRRFLNPMHRRPLFNQDNFGGSLMQNVGKRFPRNSNPFDLPPTRIQQLTHSSNKYFSSHQGNTFRLNYSLANNNPFPIQRKPILFKNEQKTMPDVPPVASQEAVTPATNTENITKEQKTKKQKRPWMIKPQMPPPMLVTTPESKEEKQRMWREYRQKMKPFKNREYHNAKRVVQRLTKKNFAELDEKEKERLKRAKEAVQAHKDLLIEKTKRRARIQEELLNNIRTVSAIGNASSSINSTSKNGSVLSTDTIQNVEKITPAASTANTAGGANYELWSHFDPRSFHTGN